MANNREESQVRDMWTCRTSATAGQLPSEELVTALLAETCNVNGYPVPAKLPHIILTSQADMLVVQGWSPKAAAQRVRQMGGVPTTLGLTGLGEGGVEAGINLFLLDTFDVANTEDCSVLLHELTHVAQYAAGWDSINHPHSSEFELPAYKTQVQYLKDHGGSQLAIEDFSYTIAELEKGHEDVAEDTPINRVEKFLRQLGAKAGIAPEQIDRDLARFNAGNDSDR